MPDRQAKRKRLNSKTQLQMENHVKKLYHRLPLFLIGLVVWSSLFVSCKDVYKYDDEQPDWLGESIYEYLVADGNYKNFVKIIDDLGYTEVLKKTGSKTLFVADDAAFERFFSDNEWGVTEYSDMTEAQKKLLLNFSVINNAYLIETLSNYYQNGLREGSALRRNTSVSYLDSVPFVSKSDMPITPRWSRFRNNASREGMYLLQDGSAYPMVHLLQKALDYYGITDDDFKIMTGMDRVRNDAFIFSNKVTTKDITCKNGYIQKLQDVLTIPSTMATYIQSVDDLSLFASMLDWFSVPVPDAAKTRTFWNYLAERNLPYSTTMDSIYTLRYFNSAGVSSGTANGRLATDPDGKTVQASMLLMFDPGYSNLINQQGTLQSDMAAIFAPTNQALEEYLLEGKGRALYDRYGSWANVMPKSTDNTELYTQKMEILTKLINRHMRQSLVISIPSVFEKMVDNTSSLLRTKKEDIVDSLNYIALNGFVYATNKVYPPDDFVSVYGPIFFSNKTLILKRAIEKYKYNLYLNSMVNKYAFVAPTDQALRYFVDPVTYGTNYPTMLEFIYSEADEKLMARIYEYDKATKSRGAYLGDADDDDFIKSRLVSILDQSIVVKDFVDTTGTYRDGFYMTKDGNFIKVNGIETLDENAVSSRNLKFQGGGDILSKPTPRNVYARDSGIYHQENGTSFLTDTLIQTPLQSVYSILGDASNYWDFSEFFELLDGFPNNEVFIKKANYYGIDAKNVKFFNSFRYTVYAPDNQAMQQAYDSAWIKPWSEINSMPDDTPEQEDAIKEEILKLERFVRYHFQDNSVFISPNQSFEGKFQTATIKLTDPEEDPSYLGTAKNKFFRISVKDTAVTVGSDTRKTVALTCERNGAEPYVVTVDVSDNKYYNIMTRDYVFDVNPSDISSRTDAVYKESQIVTSSTAVIHKIGKVLRFE